MVPLPRSIRPFLVALFIVYVAKQIVTALVFPPFTGHDEVAHYAYLRVLAHERRLPDLTRDRLPPELYQHHRFALGWRESGKYTAALYTAVHPPLYYAAMLPLYSAGRSLSPEAQQFILRLGAIPFGLFTVWMAFLLARTLFPDDAFLAVTVPAAVAFQPQVSYIAAMVNNDIAAIAFYSLLLYLLVRGVRDEFSLRLSVATGLTFGIALLAKSTSLTALPLILAAACFASRPFAPLRVLGTVCVIGVVAVVVTAPWYAYLYSTYGDFSGLSHLAAAQPFATRADGSIPEMLVSGDFAVARWQETWGEFGWRLIRVRGVLLWGTACLTILGTIGFLCYLTVTWPRSADGGEEGSPAWSTFALLLLFAACLVSYAAILQFGTTFVNTQARYYFPAVNAAAVVAMVGLRAWLRPSWYVPAQALLVLGMIVLNVIIYTAHVVPVWYFGV